MPSFQHTDLQKFVWEIQYERSRAKAYKDSLDEWRLVTAELEKQIAGAAREPTEWKTRCECQIAYNTELQQQVKDLSRRVHQERETLRNPTQVYSNDPNGVTTEADLKNLVKQLTREKNGLESQIRDTNWRLDEEAKAFHKADEKRKLLLMDVARTRQQVMTEHAKKDEQYLKRALKNLEREYKLRCAGKGKGLPPVTLSTLNTLHPGPSGGTVPERFLGRRPTLGYTSMNILRRQSVGGNPANMQLDRRILHKNKAPIKITAAVKLLPKLSQPKAIKAGSSEPHNGAQKTVMGPQSASGSNNQESAAPEAASKLPGLSAESDQVVQASHQEDNDSMEVQEIKQDLQALKDKFRKKK